MTDQQIQFTNENGEVVVRDVLTGQFRWRGKPLDFPVKELVDLTNGTAIALLNYYRAEPGPFRNLLCPALDGEVLWRAELPPGDLSEAYVRVEFDGGELTANTWSGHQATIDASTGALRGIVFTK